LVALSTAIQHSELDVPTIVRPFLDEIQLSKQENKCLNDDKTRHGHVGKVGMPKNDAKSEKIHTSHVETVRPSNQDRKHKLQQQFDTEENE
jgi:hypothetical protein